MITKTEEPLPERLGQTLCPVIGFNQHQAYPIGSCIIISDRLALTARHVAEEIHSKLSMKRIGDEQDLDYHASIVTIGSQLVWGVRGFGLSPISDLALLYFLPTEGNDDSFVFDRLTLSFSLPCPGDIVTVWGISELAMRTEAGNLQVGGYPLRSTGVVQDVHSFGRDNFLLTWPVASVNAHLKGGMSGGPVFNSEGQLCGIASLSHDGSEEEINPLMYFSLLWPLLPLHTRMPRTDLAPGTRYAFRNLIETGFVAAQGWDDEWLSLHGEAWGKLRPYILGSPDG